MTCKSAKKWYLMRMSISWLCPFSIFNPLAGNPNTRVILPLCKQALSLISWAKGVYIFQTAGRVNNVRILELCALYLFSVCEKFEPELRRHFSVYFCRFAIIIVIFVNVVAMFSPSNICLQSTHFFRPNVNFRKISVWKTIWDLEFSEHLL